MSTFSSKEGNLLFKLNIIGFWSSERWYFLTFYRVNNSLQKLIDYLIICFNFYPLFCKLFGLLFQLPQFLPLLRSLCCNQYMTDSRGCLLVFLQFHVLI